jgi:hypothetical protein
MPRSSVRATLALAAALAPLALLAAACSRPAEQQFITQFFRAARGRDNTTLAMMSAVPFDPRTQGAVDDFEITQVSDERRAPLDLRALLDAQRKAVEAEAAHKKEKIEYQNANLPALEEIVKLERDPKAKMNAAQLKIKAEWDKFRERDSFHAKAVSGARMALSNATGPAEASFTQPGQPPLNPEKFQGDLVSKDVTVAAQVRMPDGQTVPKTLVITMQKVSGTMDGSQREGRWIISRIQGA